MRCVPLHLALSVLTPLYACRPIPLHPTISLANHPPAPLSHPSSPHISALCAPWPPHSPSASVEAVLALSLPFPSQWQAVSPSEKTPDLKRALRTLLSKMKVNATRLQWNTHTRTYTPAVICTLGQPCRVLYPLSIFEAHSLIVHCQQVKQRASVGNGKLPYACFTFILLLLASPCENGRKKVIKPNVSFFR